MAKRSGFSPDQPLNLDDPKVLERLMPAMVHHEQGRDPYGPDVYARAVGDQGPMTASLDHEALGAVIGKHLRDAVREIGRTVVSGPSSTTHRPPTTTSLVDSRLAPAYPALP